jgi:hypothetical protein
MFTTPGGRLANAHTRENIDALTVFRLDYLERTQPLPVTIHNPPSELSIPLSLNVGIASRHRFVQKLELLDVLQCCWSGLKQSSKELVPYIRYG